MLCQLFQDLIILIVLVFGTLLGEEMLHAALTMRGM